MTDKLRENKLAVARSGNSRLARKEIAKQIKERLAKELPAETALVRERGKGRVDGPKKLEWKKGRKDQLDTSDRITWQSRCGRYKVEQLDSRYGLGRSFCAVRVKIEGEVLLYRGKSRAQAEAACNLASREPAI